jgi:hypothetical protein
MMDNMALDFPSFPWVILLITLYVGPALFIIKKIEIRKEQRWVLMGLIMLWVIITSSAFYGFYFTKYSRYSLSYNQFSMIRLSGPEPVPLFKEFIGIYNLKNRRTQVWLGNNPYPVKGFMFERAQDKIGHFFNLEERPLDQVVHIDLDRWSHRFFSLEGRVPFPLRPGPWKMKKGLC